MSDSLQHTFDAKAEAWETYTQTPLGRLREDLNWHYLAQHLPPAPLRILDAGCGTGGLGLRLAELGYRVHLLDLAPQMIAIAEQKARTAGVAENMTFAAIPIANYQAEKPLDVVICHTLLEYVPAVSGTIQHLADQLVAGGLLSIVFVNRHAEPLIQALGKGNLKAAQTSLTQSVAHADLFGVPRQLFTSEQIHGWLESANLAIIAEYGVRIIADTLPDMTWQTDAATYADLLRLETVLARQAPYTYIGRYGQIIAQKIEG